MSCQANEVSNAMIVDWMVYNLYHLTPPLVRGGADKVGGEVVRLDECKIDELTIG